MQRVTLTFDNGPTPGVTESVLDVLTEHRVSATFFVIGSKLQSRGARALAERAVTEGHQVGNHTLTHSVPLGTLERTGDINAVLREIDAAQEILGALAPGRLFRPYGAGGILDDRLLGPIGLAHLRENGYTPVTWNNVPRDWVDPDGWVTTCLDTMSEQDWSVVVLHDVASAALERLDSLLDAARERGVEWRQDFPVGCLL